MTLEEFRKSADLTYAKLASGIGVGGAAVAKRYCDGEQIPRPEIMARIFEYTDGQVTPNDFYGMDAAE